MSLTPLSRGPLELGSRTVYLYITPPTVKDCLLLRAYFVIERDFTKEFINHIDEAIEKGVNITFDLMAQSPLDSMVEYGKFLWRNVAFKK